MVELDSYLVVVAAEVARPFLQPRPPYPPLVVAVACQLVVAEEASSCWRAVAACFALNSAPVVVDSCQVAEALLAASATDPQN